MSKLPPIIYKTVGFIFPEKAITNETNKMITLRPLHPSIILAIFLCL